MKKIVRFAAFTLALAMLPGCGKGRTPAEPTTVNQAMLLEQSAKEQTEYTFPEKFTGDWVSQEGRLTIHADAQVVAELGTALPTATVTPRDFTQEDVDTLLRVLLKGQPLYSTVMTKQECQDSIDFVNSPKWHADPDAPEQTPEQLEARRQEIIAYYTAEMAKAPEEKPIIHGFEDSGTPNEVSGDATVDGAKYEVIIMNRLGGYLTNATIVNSDFKYYRSTQGKDPFDNGSGFLVHDQLFGFRFFGIAIWCAGSKPLAALRFGFLNCTDLENDDLLQTFAGCFFDSGCCWNRHLSRRPD